MDRLPENMAHETLYYFHRVIQQQNSVLSVLPSSIDCKS